MKFLKNKLEIVEEQLKILERNNNIKITHCNNYPKL